MKKLAPILEILDSEFGVSSTLIVSNKIWMLITNHDGKLQHFEADNFIVLNNLVDAFMLKLLEGKADD